MEIKNSTISGFRTTWFQVSSNCMAPLIKRGDLIATRPVTQIRTGDIVVVSSPLPAVHRIVKVIKGSYAVTKGDMSLQLDPPSTKDNLSGKVIAIIRKGGKPIMMETKLWRVENYLMARYSLAGYSICTAAAKHKQLVQIYHLFSSPLKHAFSILAKVLIRCATIQTG